MYGRLCNIAGTVLIVAVILITAPYFIPQIFGIQSYAVLSGSMEPVYPMGSVVYVKGVDPEEIKVGDSITFSMGAGSDEITTHRVVEIDEVNQQFETKGDANAAADAQMVSYTRLVGKVVYMLPLVGKFALLVQSSVGKAAELLILAAGALLWYLGGILKKKTLKN